MHQFGYHCYNPLFTPGMARCLLLLAVLLNLAMSTGWSRPYGLRVQCSRGFFSTTADAESPMIVDPPESMVVYTDTVANFSCEVNTVFASWIVNGTNTSDLKNDDLDAAHNTSGKNVLCTLHFTAKVEYNGSLIQCVASMPGVGFITSQNVTLLIQGNVCKALPSKFADK